MRERSLGSFTGTAAAALTVALGLVVSCTAELPSPPHGSLRGPVVEGDVAGGDPAGAPEGAGSAEAPPCRQPGAEACRFDRYNLDVAIGDRFILSDYLSCDAVPGVGVLFAYEDEETWNLDAFNADLPVEITAADELGGPRGDGRYRLSVLSVGSGRALDHATIRVGRDSELGPSRSRSGGGGASSLPVCESDPEAPPGDDADEADDSGGRGDHSGPGGGGGNGGGDDDDVAGDDDDVAGDDDDVAGDDDDVAGDDDDAAGGGDGAAPTTPSL